MEKQNNLINKIKPKVKLIIFLTIFVFLIRNGMRINDEISKYDYKPFTKTFYFIDNNHFRISNSLNNLSTFAFSKLYSEYSFSASLKISP